MIFRTTMWTMLALDADGTWVTASKLVSAEPSAAKDYVYTYWGTAWAAIGLSRALEAESHAGGPRYQRRDER